MICNNCLQEIVGDDYEYHNGIIIHPVCPSGASEASPARMSASTTGSASAAPSVQKPSCGMSVSGVSATSNTETEDEPGVVNSGVQLPVSDLFAVVQRWRWQAKRNHSNASEASAAEQRESSAYDVGEARAREKCAQDIEELISKKCPQRSGGKRRKLNKKLTDAGPDAPGLA